ncbi:MAG: glycosyltransferase family 2 protein [Gammaproteobacteria bacterium CG_4_10_14_0_8_um_filter_38_16]|nr:MAG: glycosyltransferase family 2 protein [Gammaproteobacteria bacterium CG_4_10_14_0_8_um_filter_38_16]PJA03818.1 MAG: glycosyltransferase family 2 protein [Gammaproteobacteria bacterium CG_4_10_14_0_2_um_filter_38_22]PJB10792.1 MAG: glycosyltransferase family 2 protein [Gammaproteobacteria bacterium CG_4_9_14_3_um_filter_38_9]
MQKVIIIIPTYNESENIRSILDALQRVFLKIQNYEMGILVYDSNSPDKTAHIVRDYQTQHPNVYLVIEEKKSGLGNAYIQSMQYAYKKLNADIIFEFDADGSHRPDYLPAMIKEFDHGADVVVGSRYVKGGSIPKDWAPHRKLLSVFGNVASRIVLHPKIKDYTSGFRGTRATFLKKIDLNNLRSKGYAYKIQLMWELHLLRANIVEFPIQFIDREKGNSKLPKNNAIESLWLIFYLRYRQLKRYLKVCLVGGIGITIQLMFFNLLRHFIHPAFANIISVEIAIISNFMINNFFTFSDKAFKKSHPIKTRIKKFLQFNFFSLGSIAIQTSMIFLGGYFFGHAALKDNLYVLLGIGLGSILNYKIYHHVVWKK